ncbi:MAG: hypothetical protein ABJC39_00705 [Chloroflexota bacterium]
MATILTLVVLVIIALAFADGCLGVASARREIPWSAVLIILAAAPLREPIGTLAAHVTIPGATAPPLIAYSAVALVGGVLGATLNNLPAAAFGAIWRSGAGGPFVIAYLLGTTSSRL